MFDPTCLSYRIHVYEYLREEFRNTGYNLTVFYDYAQSEIKQPGFISIKYSFVSFLKLHIARKPQISIFFIWLRYKFSLPFLVFARLFLPTKLIVWSKGINIAKINQPVINLLYYIRQRIAHALILYSEYEKQFIKTKLRKVFIANNTINQFKYKVGQTNIEKIKLKYGIKQKKIVLFVGRIQERKRLDLLLSIFCNDFINYALLIVGPGMDKEMFNIVHQRENIYYLGPVYDLEQLSDIYSISDVFCIPGEIGLGINEAFLFGLPVVTTEIRPTAEIKLLFKENINGLLYIMNDKNDLAKKLNLLLEDDDLYNKCSQEAFKSFEQNGKIELMYKGFYNSVRYVEER